MKTVILCGGKGTRLHEETEFKPKPMVKVGGVPILQHIMNIYAFYGHKDFILGLGYKGDMIKDYFLTLSRYTDDFQFDMKTGDITQLTQKSHKLDYKITFAETGIPTLSAGRVRQVLQYIDDDHFMVTYGDGVSTVNVNKLIDYHMEQERKHDICATITVVHPSSKFGRISFNKEGIVTTFEEKKPVLDDYINGGFHVYSKKAMQFLQPDEMLEDSLTRMTKAGKLAMYKHDGFWHCMDTMKHYISLNEIWNNDRPWAVWEKSIE